MRILRYGGLERMRLCREVSRGFGCAEFDMPIIRLGAKNLAA